MDTDFTETGSLSYYNVADLGHRVEGKLRFPGRNALPVGSAGYVRSEARARASARARDGLQDGQSVLPWRDYPAEVLTPSAEVLERPFDDDYLVIGCRNVLNEWGYQIRLQGRWWRRAGDPPVDDRWPVLAMLPDGARFLRSPDAVETGADLVTGLPLVIDGRPSGAGFLIANCSDVAHVFEVHPGGLLGPSAEAWRELSNLWQSARDAGRSQEELAAQLVAAAQRHGVVESRHNLHSVIAQTSDGRLLAFVLTGALETIARHIVNRWKVANAILLDNGGSVGWFYCARGRARATLLVGGAHRRENGTAFLALKTRGFPKPRMHDCLND